MSIQPWIGPDSYGEEQQDLFKGRSDERDEILRLLDRDILTVLFGASGLGKTSLLKAGVFPELRKRRMLPVYLRLDHEEHAPPLPEQILLGIARAATESAEIVECPVFAPGQSLWENFHRKNALLWSAHHEIITPVVVLDQFEEIFTRGRQSPGAAERSYALVRELADLLQNRIPELLAHKLDEAETDAIEAGFVLGAVPLKVVISLREDYLADLEQLKEQLPSLGANRMRLTPLSMSQAREVVEAPAAPYGLLAPGVTDRVLEFVSASDRSVSKGRQPQSSAKSGRISSQFEPEIDPALLSIFCFELNARRDQTDAPQITLDLLEASKEQILSGFYERAFEGIPKALRAFVEDRLVSPQGFRDSRTMDDALTVPGVTEKDLDTLVARRLLDYEERGIGPKRIELKHDVFLRIVEASRGVRILAEQRRRNLKNLLRHASIWSGPALLVLLGLGTLGYEYAYKWEHTAYYSNFVKVRGEPKGVGELTLQEVRRRAFSLRFVTQGRFGHVIRVEAIDDAEKPTVHHDIGTYVAYRDWNKPYRRVESSWSFVYDHQGRVQGETAYDRGVDGKKRPVWSFLYSLTDRVEKNGRTMRVGHFVGGRGVPPPWRGFVEVECDEATGLEIETRFFDDTYRRVPGPDHAFGQRREYDDRGRLTRLTSLEETGRPMNDIVGNAHLDLLRDDRGNAIEIRARDDQGKPTRVTDGDAVRRITRDEFGNEIAYAHFAFDGDALRPTTVRDGYHKRTQTFDRRGRLTRASNWDDKGKSSRDWNGCFQYSFVPDSSGNGNQRETACRGADGELNISVQGWATLNRRFDAWGDLESSAAFDAQGKPTNVIGDATETSTSARYHRIVYSRDEQGRETERSYFLADEKPAYLGGWSRKRTQHGENGKVSAVHYLDAAGKPAVTEDGYSSINYTHDDAGRVRRLSFRNAAGQLVLSKAGYAGVDSEYNSHGYVTSEMYFGLTGSEVLLPNGYSRVIYERDRLGNAEVTRYQGLDGETVVTASGISGYRSRFDHLGHEIERTFFDSNGRPTLSSDGSAQWTASYDHLGRKTEMTFRGLDGKPAVTSAGTAGWRADYDPWGNQTKFTNLGTASEPVLAAGSFASLRAGFDRQNNQTSVAYFDASGKPAATNNGCARIARMFDERNAKSEECFDTTDARHAEKNGVFRTEYVHDALGRVTDTCYFDTEAGPVLHRGLGYHCIQQEYDALGNVARTEYFDHDRRPLALADGVAIQIRKYASYGTLTETRALDAKKSPAKLAGGYYREARRYDDAGRLVGISYYDDRDRLVRNNDGYARVEYSYGRRTSEAGSKDVGAGASGDAQAGGSIATVPGQKPAPPTMASTWSSGEAELQYLDEHGGLVRSREGFARRESFYEADGRIRLQSFFDEHGELTSKVGSEGTGNSGRYARIEWRYSTDSHGARTTETHFFGPDGKRVLAQHNGATCATVRETRDAFGRLTKVSHLGTRGEPYPQQDGCSEKRLTYDTRGNNIRDECYLGDVKTLRSDRSHSTFVEYDTRNQPLRWSTYGPSGSVILNNLGFARANFRYDSNGNRISIATVDKNEKLILNVYGWARVDQKYDENSNMVESAYFGADEQLRMVGNVARVVWEYDSRGNAIRISRFDAKNEEISTSNRTFDRQGRLTSEKSEKQGQPIPIAGTIYEYRQRYDERGRMINQTYFGKDGKPLTGSCPATHFTYDDHGGSTSKCGPHPS